ncbi:MAG: pilus assembly protein PilZ [Hyphomicrobiales bacterium]|nr:pilus assembly protein PilZ [Hyphomicrobiales bacterium]
MLPAPCASRTRLPRQLSKPEPAIAHVVAQIDGRAMATEGQEFSCQTIAISPEEISLTTALVPLCGTRIIAYLDIFGGLQGFVSGVTDTTFVLRLQASAQKRAKTAAQILWLLERQRAGLAALRGHERIIPRHTAYRVLFADDQSANVTLLDVSRRGAAVRAPDTPAVGPRVRLGTTPARVVRALPDGFAVEFARLLPVETFGPELFL